MVRLKKNGPACFAIEKLVALIYDNYLRLTKKFAAGEIKGGGDTVFQAFFRVKKQVLAVWSVDTPGIPPTYTLLIAHFSTCAVCRILCLLVIVNI